MKTLSLLILGALVGAGALAAWRLAAYHSTAVHYHANFAVYINGNREPFAADTYYEEEAGCSADKANTPLARAHMHDKVNDLIHVEAPAVTWGEFFQNLGWGIGPNYLQTRSKLYLSDANHKLTYILNGQTMDNPAGVVIKSLDKLLVSYGTSDKAKLQTQAKSISSSAEKANTTPDPESCSGPAVSSWQTKLNYILH